jgi:outer membrane receptor protein involved in Fe transport
MFSTPLPFPNSPFVYGPEQDTNPAPSTILNFDGKLTVGNLNIYFSVPYEKRFFGAGFPGSIAQGDIAQDTLKDNMGQPLCAPSDDPSILKQPGVCLDRNRESRTDVVNYFERYGAAEYKARFSSKAGLSVKAYFIDFVRDFDRLLILMPSTILPGGLTFNAPVNVYKVGGSVDGDVEFSDKFRLLYGAEAFHEWVPDTTTAGGSRQGAGIQTIFYGPYDVSRLPVACPHTANGWDPMTGPQNIGFVDKCPVTFIFAVSRTTIGGFAAAQIRPIKKLILDGGARLQFAPELTSDARGYGLQPTASASAVYEFLPDWHLKVNYAQGFRAPVFNNTDSNGEAVEIDGRTDLKTEHSEAYQAEVNARLLKGKKRVRELDFRADYSYTKLTNFITFVGGRYDNVGDRGINAAEFLAKLYLKGGHRIELGYSYVKIDTADKGAFLSMPEHWFNFTAIANLVPDKVEAMGMLKIYGAMEDPNRRVEARGLGFNMADGTPQTVVVNPYELVVDRLPPAAELQLGVAWHPTPKLNVQGTVYNAFANKHYELDVFNDREPRLEIVPTENESFRFFASAAYTF